MNCINKFVTSKIVVIFRYNINIIVHGRILAPKYMFFLNTSTIKQYPVEITYVATYCFHSNVRLLCFMVYIAIVSCGYLKKFGTAESALRLRFLR